MLTVYALITDIRKALAEMRDTGDVTGLQGLTIKAIVCENIVQHVINKKDCSTCPSYGRGLNTSTGGSND